MPSSTGFPDSDSAMSSLQNDRRDSDASSAYDHRTSSTTPNSWYAALATEPPREEDFWEDPQEYDITDCLPTVRPGDAQFSDELPNKTALGTAGELPVYNADGNAVPFKNLFLESRDGTSRQLIIFIRHFFCRACKAYIRELKSSLPDTQSISPEASPSIAIPTNIVLISPMKASMIKRYAESNCIRYPIYADPSCQVFKALGCKSWAWIGKRSKYLKDEPGLVTAGRSLLDNYSQMLLGRARGRGAMFQVGGEFLFEDGAVSWCHRMRHMRNHTEVDVLKKVLDIDDNDEFHAGLDLDQDTRSLEVPIFYDEQRLTREELSSSHLHNEPSPSPIVRTGSIGSGRRVPNKLKKKKNSRLWHRRATGDSL